MISDRSETEIRRLARLRAKGCCGDRAWRGRLCQYHDGWEDGVMFAIEMIEKLERAGADDG